MTSNTNTLGTSCGRALGSSAAHTGHFVAMALTASGRFGADLVTGASAGYADTAALRKAQRDIDLRPELYTHYYKNEFPDRFHAMMDTRRWGPGERLVFEPYTKETYEESFEWIAAHGIFPDGGMGSGQYEKATLTLGA